MLILELYLTPGRKVAVILCTYIVGQKLEIRLHSENDYKRKNRMSQGKTKIYVIIHSYETHLTFVFDKEIEKISLE